MALPLHQSRVDGSSAPACLPPIVVEKMMDCCLVYICRNHISWRCYNNHILRRQFKMQQWHDMDATGPGKSAAVTNLMLIRTSIKTQGERQFLPQFLEFWITMDTLAAIVIVRIPGNVRFPNDSESARSNKFRKSAAPELIISILLAS